MVDKGFLIKVLQAIFATIVVFATILLMVVVCVEVQNVLFPKVIIVGAGPNGKDLTCHVLNQRGETLYLDCVASEAISN